MHMFVRSIRPSVCLSVQECTTARGAVRRDLEAHMYARNVCSVTRNHLTLRLPGQTSGQPARRTRERKGGGFHRSCLMYRQDLDDLIIPHLDLSPGSVLI